MLSCWNCVLKDWIFIHSSYETDACGVLVLFFPFKGLCWLEFSKRWRNTTPLLASNGTCFLRDSAGPAWQSRHPGLVNLGYRNSVGFHHSTPLHLVPVACKNEVRLYCDIDILHPLFHLMLTMTTPPPPPPTPHLPKPSPFQAEQAEAGRG